METCCRKIASNTVACRGVIACGGTSSVANTTTKSALAMYDETSELLSSPTWATSYKATPRFVQHYLHLIKFDQWRKYSYSLFFKTKINTIIHTGAKGWWISIEKSSKSLVVNVDVWVKNLINQCSSFREEIVKKIIIITYISIFFKKNM